MNKQKIVILNFQTSKVLIFDYDSNMYDDGEEFISRIEEFYDDLSLSNCQWMICDDLIINVY